MVSFVVVGDVELIFCDLLVFQTDVKSNNRGGYIMGEDTKGSNTNGTGHNNNNNIMADSKDAWVEIKTVRIISFPIYSQSICPL